MKAISALPYSKKALKNLEELLKVHESMLWVDPVTNTLSVKQSPQVIATEPAVVIDEIDHGNAVARQYITEQRASS